MRFVTKLLRASFPAIDHVPSNGWWWRDIYVDLWPLELDESAFSSQGHVLISSHPDNRMQKALVMILFIFNSLYIHSSWFFLSHFAHSLKDCM